MNSIIAHFVKDEDAAVTVDWVVLTAAIVGLGIGLITTIANSALDNSIGLGNKIATMDIGNY